MISDMVTGKTRLGQWLSLQLEDMYLTIINDNTRVLLTTAMELSKHPTQTLIGARDYLSHQT